MPSTTTSTARRGIREEAQSSAHAVMIDTGKAQIFERQMAQALEGFVDIDLAAGNAT